MPVQHWHSGRHWHGAGSGPVPVPLALRLAALKLGWARTASARILRLSDWARNDSFKLNRTRWHSEFEFISLILSATGSGTGVPVTRRLELPLAVARVPA